MLDTLTSLLALASILLAAYGLGRPLVRAFLAEPGDPFSVGLWSVSLGLIVAGWLLTMLGLAGWLYRPVIGVLTLAAGFWGLAELLRAWADRQERMAAGQTEGHQSALRESHDAARDLAAPPRWLICGLLLAATVACGGSLAAALAPPTAGDALCYHLELPKIFLAEHGLVDLPYHENATFPLLAEMWFLWGLAIEGGVCAQLLHWALGLLLCLAAVELATPVVGRPWAWIVGAVVALVPGVTNQMTAPLNDAALAMSTTLSLAAWRRGVHGGESRNWFVLAGLMLGAALSTKYVALVFAAAVAVPWFFEIVWPWKIGRGIAMRESMPSSDEMSRWKALLSGAAVVAVLAASVAGVWYVRAAWYRGNPVYPFFNQQLGGQAGPTAKADKTPLTWQPADIAAAPWRVTMQPQSFGGRGHQLGAMFLIALPGLLFCRRLRGLGSLLAVAGCYGLLWLALRQNLRFLLPAVPLLAVAVVWVWMEFRRLPAMPRFVCHGVLALLALFNAAVSLARGREKLPVAIGLESRVQYLLRHEPTWQAADLANDLLQAGDRILSQEHRGFYFQPRLIRESAYRRHTGYHKQIDEPGELSRTLRSDGFTHVLLAETAGDQGIRYNRKLSKLVDRQAGAEQHLPLAQRSLQELGRYEFRDSDGAVRRYRLVALE